MCVYMKYGFVIEVSLSFFISNIFKHIFFSLTVALLFTLQKSILCQYL